MASSKVGQDAGAGDGAKRKHSAIVSAATGELDLSLLDPPRPGRPSRQAAQDPAMQEARKRARVLRNRAAAQLSREKKRHHLEQLEQENAELRTKNQELEERLGRAEEANAGLAAKLDGLAQQLQSFQALVLQAQKPVTPALDWSAVTPLVASPLDSPAHSMQAAVGPSFPSFSSPPPSHSTGAAFAASSLTLPSSTPAAATAAPTREEQASSETPTQVSATEELSSKGLCESAALEQSGAHAPDSQQRRPLQYTESICRKPGQASLAIRGACSSTSSCTSWAQRMASTAVAAVVSASAESSPQTVWTIFCVLLWVLSQSGGWISRPQLSRMARGILEHSRAASADDGLKAGRTRAQRGGLGGGAAGLAVLAGWLGAGSRTAAALRRVVGDEQVDRVAALVASLRAAVRTASARRQRVRVSAGFPDKQKPVYSPP
ncbi:hypothetical protein IWW55_006235 [Coemansia sp. RSA 2706]|nr:hypothetical protein IWW55_006235 [Coemansia sp. RSA 2706]